MTSSRNGYRFLVLMLGLICVSWGIAILPWSGRSLSIFERFPLGGAGGMYKESIRGALFGPLHILAGSLLLLFSERLADWLSNPKETAILYVDTGWDVCFFVFVLRLVGFILLLRSIPMVAAECSSYLYLDSRLSGPVPWFLWSSALPAAVNIIIALYFLMGASRFVRWCVENEERRLTPITGDVR